MTDQSDLFSGTTDNPTGDPQSQPTSQAVDIFADQLKMIKNENGEQKYDSIPKALDGLAHAQSYIPQLKSALQQKEAELEALKQKLEGTASVEEIVSRLTAKQQESVEVKDATPAQEPKASLDETAVLDLFKQYSAQTEAQRLAESNLTQVSQSLMSKFGEKTQEAIKQKATELGISLAEIKELSMKSPKLVLSMFGTSPQAPSPTTNSIKTTLTTPEQPALERPKKSLLAGATSKEQAAYMEQIRQEVYRKHGITSQ